MLIRSTVFGTSLLIAAGSALAHDDNIENSGGGYVGSGGTVITTSLDSCLRSGTWSPDDQIGACEGIEEVVEEEEVVAEAPAPEVEAPKAPESRTETIAMVRNANFETDSATLTPAAESAVVAVIDELAALDNIGSLTVVGYTDSRGSESYNQGLSERRAQTVADMISSRIAGVEMSVVGLGESNPVASNDTPEGRLANRRVEVIFDGTRVIFN